MIVAAVAGWQLARTKLATLTAALLCLSLVGGAYVSHHPAAVPEFAISALACYLQTSWYAPLATALFYLAACQSYLRSLDPKRKLAQWTRMQVMLGLLATALLYAAAAPTLFSPEEIRAELRDVHAINGPAQVNGVLVRQSLNYTCGPSACATLLRAAGIDSNASEDEMAVLCMTRPHAGSSVLGMAAGLKAKTAAQGWRVKIVAPEWPEFMTLHKPAVCAMTFNGSPHVVVALEVDPEKGIHVADPVGVNSWVPFNEFKSEFNGDVVVVFRNDPLEP